MARRSAVLPTYSTRPPASHSEPTGYNRRVRRSRTRHHSVFTRTTVTRDWLDMSQLTPLGIAVRVQRIARRRGKSVSWVKKRFLADLKRHRAYQQGQAAKIKEIYEQMQQQMLQGEVHDHEHGHTGTEPASSEQSRDTDG
jgi:hypothetical protein